MCRRIRILCGQSKSGDPNIFLYSAPKLEQKSYIKEETSVALINEILKTKFCLNKGNIDVIRILNRCITDVCIPNSKTVYYFQYTSMNFVVNSQTAPHNFLTSLDLVLRRYPKCNNVNRRTFGILAKWCLHKDHWPIVIVNCKPKFVTRSIECLETFSRDEDVIMVALTFLRHILTPETSVPLFKDFGLMKAVGKLFIKLTTEWQINGEKIDLLRYLLKLIYEFISHDDYEPAHEGRYFFESLRDFLLLSPKKVIDIVVKYLEIGPKLPVSIIYFNMVDRLTDLNVDHPPYTGNKRRYGSQEYYALVESFLKLVDHPARRLLDPEERWIEALVSVLERFEKPSLRELKICVEIVEALSKCRRDTIPVQEQLSARVLPALVDKLACLAARDKNLCLNPRRRHIEVWENDPSGSGTRKVTSKPPVVYRKPRPVVTPPGDIEPQRRIPYVQRPFNGNATETLLVSKIQDLISSCASIETPVPPLQPHRLLPRLIDAFCDRVNRSGVVVSPLWRAVDDLLRTRVDTVVLTRSGTPERAFAMRRRRHELCDSCAVLWSAGRALTHHCVRLVATEQAIRAIEVALVTEKNRDKLQSLLVLPFIIGPIRLHLIMIELDGLGALLRLVDNVVHRKRAVKAIAAFVEMARDLTALPPASCQPRVPSPPIDISPLPEKVEGDSAHALRSVTFKLDDGSTVRADRDFLTKESEFFYYLLDGRFKESTENEVALRDVGRGALRLLLRMLDSQVDTMRSLHSVPVEVVLEAAALCDRYMLREMSESLVDHVQRYRITPETADAIYRWSVEFHVDALRKDVVMLALSESINDASRFTMFENLLEADVTEELLADFRTVIRRYWEDVTMNK